MIQLRPAIELDLPGLAAAARIFFDQAFAEFNHPEVMAVYMDRAFSFNQFEMEFREPDSCFLIAEKDSKIIAYARIRKNTESDHLMTGSNLELQRFYLAKHVQGTGLADDLMNACLELVKDVDWLWLGVWENNPRAIRFYEKYGFEKFGTHTFRMGEDDQIDFLMRKRIIHG